jgi:hypothetical protein
MASPVPSRPSRRELDRHRCRRPPTTLQSQVAHLRVNHHTCRFRPHRGGFRRFRALRNPPTAGFRIKETGSLETASSRGESAANPISACGSVRQNTGSWPKKMRAPLCSSVPTFQRLQPIKRSQHRLAPVHVTRQTAQRVVSGRFYAKRLAGLGAKVAVTDLPSLV